MAWKAALTRDPLLALRGEDGVGNGEYADTFVFQQEEEEREGAADDETDDEAQHSKQNTFRGAQGGAEISNILTLEEPAPVAPIQRGRRSRGSTPGGLGGEKSVFELPPASKDGRATPELDEEDRPHGRVGTALEKASRAGTSHGSGSRPGTMFGRRSTGPVVSRSEELAVARYGAGQDIVLFLKPSLPGVGHTEYSDWAQPDCHPHLMRYNVQDFLAGEDGLPTHYIEDEYYDGASIRAKDYWNLKRLGRQLLKEELPADSPLYVDRFENMRKIELLVPSRQVKYDAGGRICKALRDYSWRHRRRRAAVIIQATYRMHLTKFLKRKLQAERKQRLMEEDFRASQAREREAKKKAEEAARLAEEEKRKKAELAAQEKALQDEAAAEEAKLLQEIEALGALAAREGDGEESDDDELGEDDEDLREQVAVLKESGMSKAERTQMIALLRKARDPAAKLSDMEKSKLEMMGQMQEAERKRKEFCAALVQAFWRGKLQRRRMQAEMAARREAATRARDNAMATTLCRVYKGHIARRLLRYARAHKSRMDQLGTVVTAEGYTRGAVQRRMESRKKQLDIAVFDVQRAYRGHLGRRRYRAQETHVWELRLARAASVIQRMYRDALDRQWAMYVRRGNLQLLVGARVARNAGAARAASAEGARAGTVKPPIRANYPSGVLKSVSTLADGVPVRAQSPHRASVAAPAPSMPRGVQVRRRWGLPHGVEAYDETTRRLVAVAEALVGVQQERLGLTTHKWTDTALDSFSEGGGGSADGSTARQSTPEGAGKRVVFSGGGGATMTERALSPAEGEAYMARSFGGSLGTGALVGMASAGGGEDGVYEDEEWWVGEGAETPPELFGTDKDVYRRGVKGQIMPDYLRKQWREEQARRGERRLHAWGKPPTVFMPQRPKPGKGEKLFDLARKRDEQYAGLRTSAKIALAINRVDSSDSDSAEDDGGRGEAAAAAARGTTVHAARTARKFARLALTALPPRDPFGFGRHETQIVMDLQRKYPLQGPLQGTAALSLARRLPAAHWEQRTQKLVQTTGKKYRK